MYIHLGQETVIRSDDVIGIFDLETTTVSKNTRIFLEKAEKKGEVVNVSYELPKSFTLTNEKESKKNKVYISQISSSTLFKRSGLMNIK